MKYVADRWEVKIESRNPDWSPMIQWCETKLITTEWTYRAISIEPAGFSFVLIFCFDNEHDAFLFELTWM